MKTKGEDRKIAHYCRVDVLPNILKEGMRLFSRWKSYNRNFATRRVENSFLKFSHNAIVRFHKLFVFGGTQRAKRQIKDWKLKKRGKTRST